MRPSKYAREILDLAGRYTEFKKPMEAYQLLQRSIEAASSRLAAVCNTEPSKLIRGERISYQLRAKHERTDIEALKLYQSQLQMDDVQDELKPTERKTCPSKINKQRDDEWYSK
jgi:hypothetical protein